MRRRICVTGHEGYLGHLVCQEVVGLGCELITLRRPVADSTSQISCDTVIHCLGRLRGADPAALWMDNVAATKTVLERVQPETPTIYVSSRAVTANHPGDHYAVTKALGEQIVSAAGPHLIVRSTVLAGPSVDRVGGSFLSRMTVDALKRRRILLQTPSPEVDLLDVREAASTLARVAAFGVIDRGVIDGTSGGRGLQEVASSVLAEAHRRGLGPIVIKHVEEAENFLSNPQPRPADAWRTLQSAVDASPVPLAVTIHDTFDTYLAQEARR